MWDHYGESYDIGEPDPNRKTRWWVAVLYWAPDVVLLAILVIAVVRR